MTPSPTTSSQPAAHSSFSRPNWWAFALTVTDRLHDYVQNRDEVGLAAFSGKEAAVDGLIAYEADEDPQSDKTPSANSCRAALRRLSDHPDARHLPPELWQALVEQGADPFASDESGQSRPETPIPPQHLLLALRFAVAFGAPAAVEHHLSRDAILVLRGLDTKELDIVDTVLTHSILPGTWRCAETHQRRIRPPERVTLVSPGSTDGTIRPRHLHAMAPQIEEGLSVSRPLWILLPPDADLPAPLLAEHCIEMHLPDVNTDMMIALLCASHSRTGRIDEIATRAALPASAKLAQISATELALALRAPTPLAVAQRLAQIAGAGSDTSALDPKNNPSGITGIGATYDAARRLISNLQLWTEGGVEWTEIPHSLLLYGQPGVGKSHLARALGAAAGINFVQASCAEWQSAGHLGDLLREMRRSFQKARSLAPAVLFLDELDAIGSRTGSDRHGQNYRAQVINGLLEMMDRVSRDEGVMVIAACNHPQQIDPALLRPGRFDLKLEMPLPGTEMLHQLLSERLKTALSAAEIRQLSREAARQDHERTRE